MKSRAVALVSVICFLLLFIFTGEAFAERDGDQIWAMAALQGGFGFLNPKLDRVKGYLELQGRWRSFESLETAFLPRFALGYAITPQITAFAGFANVETDAARKKPYSELRPYEQLTWNLPVTGFTLQSRTRLEQRIIQDNLGWRLREFVKGSVPIPGIDRIYLAAYDELFFELDDTSWGQRKGLRQNRFFVGPGFRLDQSKHISLEVGYVNQWIDKKKWDRVNHVLALNLFFNY